MAGQLVRVHVVRVDGDRGAGRRQAPDDGALAAVVDDGDAHVAVLVRDVRLGGRNLAGQRLACHARQRFDLLERCVDAGSHRPVVSQVQDERSCVHSRQADDAVLGQPVRPLRAAGLAHDDALT